MSYSSTIDKKDTSKKKITCHEKPHYNYGGYQSQKVGERTTPDKIENRMNQNRLKAGFGDSEKSLSNKPVSVNKPSPKVENKTLTKPKADQREYNSNGSIYSTIKESWDIFGSAQYENPKKKSPARKRNPKDSKNYSTDGSKYENQRSTQNYTTEPLQPKGPTPKRVNPKKIISPPENAREGKPVAPLPHELNPRKPTPPPERPSSISNPTSSQKPPKGQKYYPQTQSKDDNSEDDYEVPRALHPVGYSQNQDHSANPKYPQAPPEPTRHSRHPPNQHSEDGTPNNQVCPITKEKQTHDLTVDPTADEIIEEEAQLAEFIISTKK
jgi:hypothetical protein